ncbi:MAG: hypothetical protein JXX14_19820 [Deltaproteobacteria bacterium]|nr:hypothetical protein [Deltaproteobacteria bacterium]
MLNISHIRYCCLLPLLLLLLLVRIQPVCAQTLQVAADVQLQMTSVHALSSEAVYTVTNTGDTPVSQVSFLLYPNQYGELSQNLPVFAREWIYPSGFSPGGIKITSVATATGDHPLKKSFQPFQMGEDHIPGFIMTVLLPQPLAQAAQTQIKIGFTVTVPTRRGRFGYFDGVLSLAGGWLPRPLPVKAEFDYQPIPMALTLSATIPAGFGGFAVNRIFVGREKAQRIEVHGSHVSEATLVLMDKMTYRTVSRDEGDIHYITNRYAGNVNIDPRIRISPQKRRQATSVANRIRRTFGIVDDVRALFKPFGLPKRDMFVLEIPTWDRLSQLSGDVVILSDRTFEVVPYPKALMFHESDVAKTVATAIVSASTQKKEQAAFQFVAEVIGYHFQQRYIQAAKAKREELAQLLRFLAFNPYVDNLIYAPQMPFDHAYLQSIEEPDAFRAELWRTLNQLPRGKRIVAKLTDLMGKEKLDSFFDNYLKSDTPFLRYLDTHIENATRFRQQWFGPYPRVGYALGKTQSRKAGKEYVHTVEIIQSGQPIVEPVTVLIKDLRNGQTRLQWDGEGTRKTLTWQSKARLKSVQIDPDYRLVETAKVQGHPLSDNTRPLKLRPPLLTDLLIWGDSVTREPFMLISFSFRRKYDISNSFHATGAYTPRQIGGDLSYFRHFGFNRTLNARTWYAGPRLGVYKYLDATATEPGLHKNNRYTATLASITMLAGMDEREFQLDPQSGKAFQISLGYWIGRSEIEDTVRYEDGRPRIINDTVQHAKGSLRLFKVIPLSLGHILVAYCGISAVEGEPPASNLVTLSHQQILRGFDIGETYGRVGVYGVTEYRHTLIGSTTLRFPMRTLLSRVQGVLFTGAGSASRPQTYRSLFQPDRNFMEVGYGFRFHMLLLGAVPYLLALDFVVPVFPRDRRYTRIDEDTDDVQYYSRAPFRFTFGVTQTF